MESLLERIEDNKLDALYLFINETLSIRDEFDRFFASLMTVLPINWSIQRVEIGHQFLSMVSQQSQLFDVLSGLEGLRTLIISDGYVPRKDRGSIQTEIMLDKMSKARNLQILDLQRFQLQSHDQVELLSEFLELQESLEELRLTGLFVHPGTTLDPAIESCCQMPNLRSLSLSASKHEEGTALARNAGRNHPVPAAAAVARPIDGTATTTTSSSSTTTVPQHRSLIETSLQDLLQTSTTLQDLSLRSMHLTDQQCQTIADALNGSSFLTSLDLRQNDDISETGFACILQALERNYDLWCSVLVDNDTYQAKFNSLIELNQANRGDLIRSPTQEKLITFLETLKDDPTAIFHFFSIHDSILYPMVDYLQWRCHLQSKRIREQQISSTALPSSSLPSSSSSNNNNNNKNINDNNTISSNTNNSNPNKRTLTMASLPSSLSSQELQTDSDDVKKMRLVLPSSSSYTSTAAEVSTIGTTTVSQPSLTSAMAAAAAATAASMSSSSSLSMALSTNGLTTTTTAAAAATTTTTNEPKKDY